MAGNDGAASLQVCALRIARLAADGTTPAGATNMVVTNQLATLAVNPVYEAGEEIVVKNGCGGLAYAFKDADRLKRADVTLTLTTPDPELSEMLGAMSLITSGGLSIGAAFQAVASNPGSGVSIEAWSKAWIGGGQPPGSTFADGATTNASPTLTSASATFSVADVGRTVTGTGIPGGTTILTVTNATTVTLSANATATATGVSITIGRPGNYWRWVLPKAVLTPQDRNLANAGLTPVFSGPAYENAAWGNGPLNDYPSGAVVGRVLSYYRDAALPTPLQAGYQTVPAQV